MLTDDRTKWYGMARAIRSGTKTMHDTPGNPFSTLGAPAAFHIDMDAVERAYLRLAAQIHPDAAGTHDDHARAAALHKARTTLRHAPSRAQALLAVLAPAQAAMKDTSLPPGFLMEVMEMRQRAEAADDPSAKSQALAWADEHAKMLASRVAAAFERIRNGEIDAGAQDVRTALNAWRYVERLTQQLSQD